MPTDRLQLQRLEFKYIITEDIALAVRDFVSLYLELDEYGASQKNLSYPIHSLYLDTDDLECYWATINGLKNRFKLRLRFYESRPNAPVYFEIKRRMNNAILKQRGPVKREAVQDLLNGQMPGWDVMASSEPRHLKAVQHFCELMSEKRAKPKSHVAYYREAWLSPGNTNVRVTLDRQVRCEPEREAKLEPEIKQPIYPFGNHVVLELKFTGRFPEWFKELVHTFGLTQSAASKYVDGILVGGENLFAPQYKKDVEKVNPKVLIRKNRLETVLTGLTGNNKREF
ncbi:MAG: VTC domain-containing protein [Verrucomicrobiia bacterium]|jgi:hypothetical protein